MTSFQPRRALRAGCHFVATNGAPFLVLFLPIVFNPYAREAFEPVKVTVLRWTVVAMLVAYLLERYVTNDEAPKSGGDSPGRSVSGLVLCVWAFVAILILATISSVDRSQSFWGFGTAKHGTLTTLALVALFFIARFAFDEVEQRDRLERAILVGSVPVTLYGVVQVLGLDPLSWSTDSVSPVHSTLGRSNFLGAYLTMVIPFVLARMVFEWQASPNCGRARGLLKLAVLGLLQITTILATQARAAWLALSAAIVVFSVALWWRRNRRVCLLVCAAMLVLGLGLLPVMNRIDLLETAGLSSPRGGTGEAFGERRAHTIESRFRVWEAALSIIPERWLLGFGPETFPTVLAERYPSIAFPGSGIRVTDPHNLLICHLFTTGLLGLSVLVALISAFFAVALRRLRPRDSKPTAVAATSAAMTAYLVHSQFNPDVIVLSVFFWTILSMGGRNVEGVRSCDNTHSRLEHPVRNGAPGEL